MDYQVILKIPFSAMDDVEARDKAKDIVANPVLYKEQTGVKFQKVHKDRAPEGIKL
jgi:hypothetical protein